MFCLAHFLAGCCCSKTALPPNWLDIAALKRPCRLPCRQEFFVLDQDGGVACHAMLKDAVSASSCTFICCCLHRAYMLRGDRQREGYAPPMCCTQPSVRNMGQLSRFSLAQRNSQSLGTEQLGTCNLAPSALVQMVPECAGAILVQCWCNASAYWHMLTLSTSCMRCRHVVGHGTRAKVRQPLCFVWFGLFCLFDPWALYR